MSFLNAVSGQSTFDDQKAGSLQSNELSHWITQLMQFGALPRFILLADLSSIVMSLWILVFATTIVHLVVMNVFSTSIGGESRLSYCFTIRCGKAGAAQTVNHKCPFVI